MGRSEQAPPEQEAGEPLARLLERSDEVARELERVRLRLLELERSLTSGAPEVVELDEARKRSSDER